MINNLIVNNTPDFIRISSSDMTEALHQGQFKDIFALINSIIYNKLDYIVDSWVTDNDINKIDLELYDKLIDSIYCNCCDSGLNEDLVLNHDLISDEAKKNFSRRFDPDYYQDQN